MKHLLLIISALFLAGCAGSSGTGQRVALDTLATAGGGIAAYFAGGKDPALTTAGAVGGFVVSEAFQTMARSGRQNAYHSGVEEGRAIGQQQVLQGLWEESNGLPRNRRMEFFPVLTVPAREQNGVRYDAHQAPSQTIKPEKILTNQPAISKTPASEDPSAAATTHQTNTLHYETFQTTP
ncbi:MAG: hypothetical protein PHV34_13990 [Verrucomicrobiae bacterium]|nr:hypothetical protein [Verrucomicrobiae bacterium]